MFWTLTQPMLPSIFYTHLIQFCVQIYQHNSKLAQCPHYCWWSPNPCVKLSLHLATACEQDIKMQKLLCLRRQRCIPGLEVISDLLSFDWLNLSNLLYAQGVHFSVCIRSIFRYRCEVHFYCISSQHFDCLLLDVCFLETPHYHRTSSSLPGIGVLCSYLYC